MDVFELRDGKPYLVDYIPEDEEIDRQVEEVIEERFPAKKIISFLCENVVNIKGNKPLSQAFNTYKNFVDAATAKGEQAKAALAQKRARLEEIEIEENGEIRRVWVYKNKIKGGK